MVMFIRICWNDLFLSQKIEIGIAEERKEMQELRSFAIQKKVVTIE